MKPDRSGRAPSRPLSRFGVRPLEAINFAALLLLCGLTLLYYRRLADPGELLLRYALMGLFLALVVVLVRRYARLPPALRVAVDFYPTAFIPFVFESLGPLIPAVRGAARDDLLIAWDRALFGVDPTVWLERLARPFWTDFFFIAYTTYYFVPLVLGGLLWERNTPEARRFIFGLTFCFYVSYAGYFTIPALGPRYALAEEQSSPIVTTAVSRAISEAINQVEHTKLDVFPSGHTMIAVAVLIYAYRRARRAFWVMLPVVVCLLISTVYCRYHYVVDVIAGLVLAFAAVPVADRLYRKLGGETSTLLQSSRS
ncbi:MAG: phosphatase PAP2 family protein [Thermoanaerobaculia bacterium]